MFQLVRIAPGLVVGHHWKGPGPIILTPTLQISLGIDKITTQFSLVQAEQNQVSHTLLIREVLQPPDHLGSSPLDLLKQFPVLLKLGGAQNWTQSSKCGLTRAE